MNKHSLELLKAGIKQLGYEGLYNPNGYCGCGLDDLAPGDEGCGMSIACGECMGAYKGNPQQPNEYGALPTDDWYYKNKEDAEASKVAV